MAPELIETLLVDAEGEIPLLARHLARLQATCAALGYPCDGNAVERDLRMAAVSLVTPGPHRLRLLLDRAGRRHIQTAALAALAPGQQVMLSDQVLDAREPLLRYKTTHRPWYADATAWLAAHPGVFDMLFLNQRGELCEGSRTNVYLQLRGVWYTPPPDSGCLLGVQRAELLNSERAHERVLTLEDLHAADGIRVSNALRGWFDVTLRVG
ncbi:aminotransferase class IV family protein [Bordetella sp. BOR01]|uniref:aminotransferase class IV family protein n=1 Tax=Bordetella sp. BOR01 TaxID=2854779 RepID=UPI001C493CE2|nr:aminotransferase class IV family protein [Bordetella sp. BOR01]MBV7481601.1 aminotransferase class IV family protein [Bordetella sp. BOR01]